MCINNRKYLSINNLVSFQEMNKHCVCYKNTNPINSSVFNRKILIFIFINNIFKNYFTIKNNCLDFLGSQESILNIFRNRFFFFYSGNNGISALGQMTANWYGL